MCPIGQFAAPGDLECTVAPAGSFVDTVGATEPTLCAVGTYQPLSSQSSCIDADAGSYVPATGAIDTIICPEDNYCPAGSSAPIACPTNTVSDEGSSSESDCVLLPPPEPEPEEKKSCEALNKENPGKAKGKERAKENNNCN